MSISQWKLYVIFILLCLSSLQHFMVWYSISFPYSHFSLFNIICQFQKKTSSCFHVTQDFLLFVNFFFFSSSLSFKWDMKIKPCTKHRHIYYIQERYRLQLYHYFWNFNELYKTLDTYLCIKQCRSFIGWS